MVFDGIKIMLADRRHRKGIENKIRRGRELVEQYRSQSQVPILTMDISQVIYEGCDGNTKLRDFFRQEGIPLTEPPDMEDFKLKGGRIDWPRYWKCDDSGIGQIEIRYFDCERLPQMVTTGTDRDETSHRYRENRPDIPTENMTRTCSSISDLRYSHERSLYERGLVGAAFYDASKLELIRPLSSGDKQFLTPPLEALIAVTVSPVLGNKA